MPETIIPRLPSVRAANLALAVARERLAAHRLDLAQAASGDEDRADRYGRRPDLDVPCAECVRDGVASTRYGHGIALAFRAAPTNRKDKEWPYRRYKAETVLQCPYHGEVSSTSFELLAAALA